MARGIAGMRDVISQWQAAAMQVLVRICAPCAALGKLAAALEPLYADDPHYLIKLIRYPGRDAIDAGQASAPTRTPD